jgi:hypothetical protein
VLAIQRPERLSFLVGACKVSFRTNKEVEITMEQERES